MRLPPYQRTVQQMTTARRVVWSYLFDSALDRSLEWFSGLPTVLRILERAVNYIARPFDTMGL